MRTLLALALTLLASSWGADPALPSKTEVLELATRAQHYLLAQAQANHALAPGDKFILGTTQVCLLGLALEPAVPLSDPRIQGALAFMQGFQQSDGGVYSPAEGLANYGTSLALQVWAATRSGSPEDIRRAQQFLFGIQNHEAGSVNQGGMGYGSRGAGNEDLLNTSYAINALRASGIPASDPHLQEALRFVERCQNLSSVNKLPWVTDDGGAVYAPDESKAGGSWDKKSATPPAEKPRLVSYGTMTYTLISSYLALDLAKDDPRLQAALSWCRSHYQFSANPGMAKGKELQGLMYYYTIMAKTYDLLRQGSLPLGDGRTVDWRADLFAAIRDHATMTGDGAMWINAADRWAEGSPQLCTAYMLMALKRIHQNLP